MADFRSKMPEVKNVARMDLEETFADSLHDFIFDGNTVRMEFTANRLDFSSPVDKRQASRVPVVRLVMPSRGFVDMFNKLNRLMNALESQGVVKQAADEKSLKDDKVENLTSTNGSKEKN